MYNHYKILRSWADIPEEEYLEYLMKNYRDNVFYIDKCPFSVTSAGKFDQFDTFYQQVLEDKKLKKIFLDIEIKYRNVMTKLWLYNTLSVEFAKEWVWLKKKNRIVDKEFRGSFKELQKKLLVTDVITVEKKLELELITQLTIRDVAGASFYFEEFELIVFPSWSCFIVYIHDLSKKEIVKEIVTTEGLYVRDVI